jgi:hypothetical protein
MKTIHSRIDPAFIAGTLLIYPAAYFFLSNILNDLNYPFLWKQIAPYFDRPENKSLGWNANLLIVFGPIVAILLNLPKLLQIRLNKKENEPLELAAFIKLNSIHWLVVIAGLVVTSVLMAYLIGENCNCFE